jgi:exopolysaccharide production protein ExoY
MHTVCDKPRLTTPVIVTSSPLPAWKRCLDLACCIAALPLLAVCTLVMTVITKIVSPGPVFFRQERVGYKGRRFKIYKFRSMTLGADTAGHQSYYKDLIGTNAPMVKLDSRGDTRLLPGAWLLRASGLDELPQLINVLRGEMSLIGPRPCIPSEFEEYLPWQQKRCDAVPGLTGLWQVSGKNRTTFEEMIRFDIEYCHMLSPGLDLKILFLTLPALMQQIYDTRISRKPRSKNRHSVSGILQLKPHHDSRTPF